MGIDGDGGGLMWDLAGIAFVVRQTWEGLRRAQPDKTPALILCYVGEGFDRLSLTGARPGKKLGNS